ncbi:MAG: hypothetical protein Q8N06_00540 [Hydrogenophaga sp.]|nr:hypothetical protein [Hydrogenophaga sp.]
MLLNLTGRTMRSFLGWSIGVLALILVCIKVWATRSENINWDIALSGFSPIDWVNHFKFASNFVSDFPSGSHSYNASLFMHAYKLADSLLGMEAELLLPGVILFEMLFMGFASVIFFRALIPAAVPIAAFVFAILVVNSGSRSMELAGFGGPFFWGLYYNFADGMRLLALALVLQRRFFVAALLFVLSVTTHPIMGVMGGIFALGCFMSVRQKGDINKIFVSSAVFLLLAGGWWFHQLQNVDVASTSIPSQIWISFSRAFNYHFYPVANGLLTFEFERRFLPFLALLLLATFYVFRIPVPERTRNGILAGGGMLLVVTMAGLAISHWSGSPGLIRLTLTRASDMLILVNLAVVVAGLLSELEKGRFVQAALASGLLLAPFIGPPVPVAYVLLIVVSQLPFLRPENFTRNDKAALALVVAFSVFLLTYYQLGFVHLDYETIYFGHKQLWLTTLYVAIGVLVADLVRPFSVILRQVGVIAVVVLIFSKSLYWGGTVNIGPRDKPMGEAYLSAQLWAKENTASTALFLVDPTIYYGWRDFSQRSSFGNMREWLHTSWLYDSKRDNYDEGLRRAAEFGYSPPDYLNESPPLKGFDKIDAVVGARFYSSDADWFRALAKKYSLDYIVMKKERVKARLLLPVAYENEFFVIHQFPVDGRAATPVQRLGVP